MEFSGVFFSTLSMVFSFKSMNFSLISSNVYDFSDFSISSIIGR